MRCIKVKIVERHEGQAYAERTQGRDNTLISLVYNYRIHIEHLKRREGTVKPVCMQIHQHGRLLRLTLSCSRAVTLTPQVCSPGSSHVDDTPWTGFGEAARVMTGKIIQES